MNSGASYYALVVRQFMLNFTGSSLKIILRFQTWSRNKHDDPDNDDATTRVIFVAIVIIIATISTIIISSNSIIIVAMAVINSKNCFTKANWKKYESDFFSCVCLSYYINFVHKFSDEMVGIVIVMTLAQIKRRANQ